jgi:hypothetical protein
MCSFGVTWALPETNNCECASFFEEIPMQSLSGAQKLHNRRLSSESAYVPAENLHIRINSAHLRATGRATGPLNDKHLHIRVNSAHLRVTESGARPLQRIS